MLYVGNTKYKVMVGNQRSTFVAEQAQHGYRNLWNMLSPNLQVGVAAGYTASSKTIDEDGTISWKRNSTSTAARIQIIMSASELGLVNGKQYTVKVWVDDNKWGSTRDSQIWFNGAYQNVFGPGPVSITWIQANDNNVRVGNLYPANFPVGETFSFRVAVAEGDTIDEYIPYSN